MPIERALGGYRWGTRGKVYRGARAREKAARQGRAVEWRKGKAPRRGLLG